MARYEQEDVVIADRGINGTANTPSNAYTAQMTVTATDLAANDTDVTADATYWSSDTDVATVDAAGEVTAVDDGTADINAQYRDETDSVTVTVATA